MVLHDERHDGFARGRVQNSPGGNKVGEGGIQGNREKIDRLGRFDEMTSDCAENAIRLAGNTINFAMNAI